MDWSSFASFVQIFIVFFMHTLCIIGIDNEIIVQPSACQQCVFGAGISVCVYSGRAFRKTVIIFAVPFALSLVLADLS